MGLFSKFHLGVNIKIQLLYLQTGFGRVQARTLEPATERTPYDGRQNQLKC